jgi:hypothetical protein
MNTTPREEDLLPCPCCGSRVLGEVGDYEICSVCGWEDDPTQRANPDYAGGANNSSLNECRKAWLVRSTKP